MADNLVIDLASLQAITSLPSHLPTEVYLRESSPALAHPLPSPSPLSLPLSDSQRDALYSELQPLVRRLVRQYGDTNEMREDLKGEIYCRFCALLDAYDCSRGVPLRAYLIRQLTCSTYTYARSQWRRQSREISLEPELLGGGRHPVDPTPAWDEQILRKDVRQALPDAIQRLSDRQRQVIILRYYEGYAYEEISQVLGVKEATVRSLARHAINNLRRQFAILGLSLD